MSWRAVRSARGLFVRRRGNWCSQRGRCCKWRRRLRVMYLVVLAGCLLFRQLSDTKRHLFVMIIKLSQACRVLRLMRMLTATRVWGTEDAGRRLDNPSGVTWCRAISNHWWRWRVLQRPSRPMRHDRRRFHDVVVAQHRCSLRTLASAASRHEHGQIQPGRFALLFKVSCERPVHIQ